MRCNSNNIQSCISNAELTNLFVLILHCSISLPLSGGGTIFSPKLWKGWIRRKKKRVPGGTSSCHGYLLGGWEAYYISCQKKTFENKIWLWGLNLLNFFLLANWLTEKIAKLCFARWYQCPGWHCLNSFFTFWSFCLVDINFLQIIIRPKKNLFMGSEKLFNFFRTRKGI